MSAHCEQTMRYTQTQRHHTLASNCGDTIPRRPGEWAIRMTEWPKQIRGPLFVFGCPRGRGACGVPVYPAPPNSNDAVWTWDGDVHAPTLSPSINCMSPKDPNAGCKWHGFVRKGVVA